MLTRPRVSIFLVLLCLVGSPGPASADAGPTPVAGDNQTGLVTTTIQTSGAAPGGGGPGAAPAGSGPTCTWTQESAASEQLLQGLPGWGHPGGHWYDVRCSDGSVFVAVYVPPAVGNAPAVAAADLARRVVNQLPLPLPTVARNPIGQALVNLPEWLWLSAAQWRPLVQRTVLGPVWVVVTATPTSTSWDPGNGSVPLVCAGPGTPYDTSRSPEAQSTDCSYTYLRSSANQPQTGPDPNDRFFTVTVTTTWQVSWVGSGGSSGTLPVMRRTSSFPLAVAKRETVVTGGSG